MSELKRAWWDAKWNKDNICGISHARLRPGKTKSGIPYTIQLNCNHRFYTNCLLHWMSVKKGEVRCPCCRRPFTLQDMINKL